MTVEGWNTRAAVNFYHIWMGMTCDGDEVKTNGTPRTTSTTINL